jgi:hypothetical protein
MARRRRGGKKTSNLSFAQQGDGKWKNKEKVSKVKGMGDIGKI